MPFLFAALFTVFTLAGCGQQQDKNKKTDEAVSLWGEWEGHLYELTDANVSRKVTLSLTAEGGFVILGDNMRASGRFTEFSDNRSILLEMHESTDSFLGLKGSLQDFNYVVAADELVLRSERYVYKLKRTKAADSVISLDGRWVCLDSSSNRWELSVQKSDFWAQVAKTSGSPPVLIRGTIQYAAQEQANKLQARVFVQSSQPRTDIGIIVIEKEAQTMAMVLLDKENQPLQGGRPISCQAL